MPQPGGRAVTLHRRHRMIRQTLHEYATAISTAGHANRSRRLIKCAKEFGHFQKLTMPAVTTFCVGLYEQEKPLASTIAAMPPVTPQRKINSCTREIPKKGANNELSNFAKVCQPSIGLQDLIKARAPTRRATTPSRSARSPINTVVCAFTPAAAIIHSRPRGCGLSNPMFSSLAETIRFAVNPNALSFASAG